MSETQLAKDMGILQPSLNRTIKRGTLKYIDFVTILEKYGYSLEIKKKEQEQQQ